MPSSGLSHPRQANPGILDTVRIDSARTRLKLGLIGNSTPGSVPIDYLSITSFLNWLPTHRNALPISHLLALALIEGGW